MNNAATNTGSLPLRLFSFAIFTFLPQEKILSNLIKKPMTDHLLQNKCIS